MDCRFLKYLIISLISYAALTYLPNKSHTMEINLNISMIIGISYALMDLVLPSVNYTNNSQESENQFLF